MSRRVRALWLPAVAGTLATEATLYLVMRSGYRPWTILLDWHCGTAWALVSFVLAPGLALALGLLVAATRWDRVPGADSDAGQTEAGRA